MPSIRATDSSVIDDVLVIGFSKSSGGSKKSPQFNLHSGDLKVDVSSLLEALDDLGASGAADEVIKLPGRASKLIVLTGLGQAPSNNRFAHETLRRAAGAAARNLAGHSSATFALPHSNLDEFAAISEERY